MQAAAGTLGWRGRGAGGGLRSGITPSNILTTQVGLSEHDLNRARSVLGLPVSGAGARGEQDTDLGYDSQPASTRNSINVSTAHAQSLAAAAS